MSFLLNVFVLSAQDSRLADQYFENGEYEKAATLYEKFMQQNNGGDFYFDRYIECLVALERLADCEKALLKQLKKEPQKVRYYVSLGKVYEHQGKTNEAEKTYKKAIEKVTPERFEIQRLADAFMRENNTDLAQETYERGAVLLKNKYLFALNLAELYRRKGDILKMTDMLLIAIGENPDNLGYAQMMFQRFYEKEEDFTNLQNLLYTKIQEKPDAPIYVELLAWVFLQKKDYKNAFRQIKSLDKLYQEDGYRVFQLANNAENDGDYDAAIDGYSYIVTTKNAKNPLFITAKQKALACKRKKLTSGYDFSINELRILEQEYETYLIEIGRYNGTAQIMMELADLEALYLNDVDKAIKTLQEVIEIPMLQPQLQARAKLALGDYYLIKGENWEATLLYSQVDKAFKDDVLGHEARFRNAKLAYYKGDFAWAKTQFGVLKSSTSKLIANDAIDMDVFITDNMGLDSNTTALEMYANAELLMFQNRFTEAFATMDSVLTMYPQHALNDDVLYLKAKIHRKKREYEKAIEYYNLILKNHVEEIRADNALFEMAELYEVPLKNKEKAKELYEKLFNEFSASTLAVEARKKYRILRGDKVPQ